MPFEVGGIKRGTTARGPSDGFVWSGRCVEAPVLADVEGFPLEAWVLAQRRLHARVIRYQVRDDLSLIIEASEEFCLRVVEREHQRESLAALHDKLLGPGGNLVLGRRAIGTQQGAELYLDLLRLDGHIRG